MAITTGNGSDVDCPELPKCPGERRRTSKPSMRGESVPFEDHPPQASDPPSRRNSHTGLGSGGISGLSSVSET